MKYNCSHTFTLIAESQVDFDEKIRRYSKLVRRASERLDIGYSHGLVFGQRGEPETFERSIDNNVERLFDD